MTQMKRSSVESLGRNLLQVPSVTGGGAWGGCDRSDAFRREGRLGGTSVASTAPASGAVHASV